MNAKTASGDLRRFKADLARLMREERVAFDREVTLIRKAVAAESEFALELLALYKPDWRRDAPHHPRAGT